jgi:hypothetical protein
MQDATDQGASDALIADLGQQLLAMKAALREAKRARRSAETRMEQAYSALGFEASKVEMLEAELKALAVDTDALMVRFEEEYAFDFSDDETEPEGSSAGEGETGTSAAAGCVSNSSGMAPADASGHGALVQNAVSGSVAVDGTDGTCGPSGNTGIGEGISGGQQTVTHVGQVSGALKDAAKDGAGSGGVVTGESDEGVGVTGTAADVSVGVLSLQAGLGVALGESSAAGASTQPGAPGDSFQGFLPPRAEDVEPPLWPSGASEGSDNIGPWNGQAARAPESSGMERTEGTPDAEPSRKEEASSAGPKNGTDLAVQPATTSEVVSTSLSSPATGKPPLAPTACVLPKQVEAAKHGSPTTSGQQGQPTMGGWLVPQAGAPPDPQNFWDNDDDDDAWGSPAAKDMSATPPGNSSASAQPISADEDGGSAVWGQKPAEVTGSACLQAVSANEDGGNAGWGQQPEEVKSSSADVVLESSQGPAEAQAGAQSNGWGSGWNSPSPVASGAADNALPGLAFWANQQAAAAPAAAPESEGAAPWDSDWGAPESASQSAPATAALNGGEAPWDASWGTENAAQRADAGTQAAPNAGAAGLWNSGMGIQQDVGQNAAAIAPEAQGGAPWDVDANGSEGSAAVEGRGPGAAASEAAQWVAGWGPGESAAQPGAEAGPGSAGLDGTGSLAQNGMPQTNGAHFSSNDAETPWSGWGTAGSAALPPPAAEGAVPWETAAPLGADSGPAQAVAAAVTTGNNDNAQAWSAGWGDDKIAGTDAPWDEGWGV